VKGRVNNIKIFFDTEFTGLRKDTTLIRSLDIGLMDTGRDEVIW